MRNLLKPLALALVAILALTPIASAQQPQVFYTEVTSLAGTATAVNGSTSAASCMIIKYRGTTVGKPDVTVAAGGDLTLRIAAVADVSTGTAVNGIFDLSTPAAADDTMGELVNRINTQGTNWVAVLTGCLASDFTDNTIDTLAATDAAAPGGVVLFKDAVVASATTTFSAQVALYPADGATNIQFHLSGGAVGTPTGSTKVNPNPLNRYQTFVQNVREKITSTGTIGLFEILGVKRTYDQNGKVAEVVRTIWSETGAATTVEKAKDFNSGPIVSNPGELIVIRQRTGTDLTVNSIQGNAYAVRNSNK